ncbi:MAG TPA: bifunctional DNA-formamidopyrimidine glycosylase/DNA-(apurinic or apyrimidinic site) lyase [Candidatus Saccharimonadales bacterium]|jgi:formamidopyrimidine-DNA glycosylase|nr:bifunctional DNA-formamidopyrimidine glycosylase/DNA-(apurinic or apyrimidinic site) lyase [Candidatus Saccharimonadales bacterium]
MPELPEVETVRRGLQELIVGRSVASEEHDTAKGFPNATVDVESFLIGATIIAVRRRAKVLLIDLSTDYTLVIHLKMTGQLVYRGEQVFGAGHPNESLIGALPDKSTRVTIEFTDGSHLYFNDQRKFGWMRLMPTVEVPNIDFMKKVGPEPLEADFTAQEFASRFTRRAKTSIKAALLDQSVIAGVGNIYADESLWGAKIHPKRLVNTITDKEFQVLYAELREVMNLAIEKGGSTDKNYVNAEGKRGSYMDFAHAFRREGLPCPRCGTEIIKFKTGGRGTHICPNCQTL